MAKAPKKPPKPKDEDPDQSRRFLDTAKAMEDAGDLRPDEDGGAFNRLLDRAAPAKARGQSGSRR